MGNQEQQKKAQADTEMDLLKALENTRKEWQGISISSISKFIKQIFDEEEIGSLVEELNPKRFILGIILEEAKNIQDIAGRGDENDLVHTDILYDRVQEIEREINEMV